MGTNTPIVASLVYAYYRTMNGRLAVFLVRSLPDNSDPYSFPSDVQKCGSLFNEAENYADTVM